MAYATSSAFTSVPSSYLRPSLSVNVHSVLSSLGVPRSVAMSGTSSISPFSGLYAYCVSARVTRFMISVESVK